MLTDSGSLGYFSHMPVLALALMKTSGPVIEMGVGWGSTPMLKMICKSFNRSLISYESDREWAKQFDATFVLDWRHFDIDLDYSIAFIDCAPGDQRKDLALKLKGRATYIILHDAESDPPGDYRYHEIIPQFKYHEFYRTLRPSTLVLSDVAPLGLENQ